MARSRLAARPRGSLLLWTALALASTMCWPMAAAHKHKPLTAAPSHVPTMSLLPTTSPAPTTVCPDGYKFGERIGKCYLVRKKVVFSIMLHGATNSPVALILGWVVSRTL